MKELARHLDLTTYLKAVPLLLRHPSLLVMPLGAGAMSLLASSVGRTMTDPLGGIGMGLIQMVVQAIYLFAFGVAVIQANNVWRERKGGFDAAWEEARRKAGGIFIAAIGFYFLLYVANLVGSLITPLLGTIAEVIAAFFLIYTIPAASIGGAAGSEALSASIRAARSFPLPTAILAIVFVGLWYFVPLWLVVPFGDRLGVLGSQIALIAAQAIVLAYLALPFAKQYDDIAFTRPW
ncbi:MAG: hypothetical protein ACLQPV_10585 [Vulcanimicrobiaceae bacterium]